MCTQAVTVLQTGALYTHCSLTYQTAGQSPNQCTPTELLTEYTELIDPVHKYVKGLMMAAHKHGKGLTDPVHKYIKGLMMAAHKHGKGLTDPCTQACQCFLAYYGGYRTKVNN